MLLKLNRMYLSLVTLIKVWELVLGHYLCSSESTARAEGFWAISVVGSEVMEKENDACTSGERWYVMELVAAKYD